MAALPQDKPIFNLGESKFDQSTYYGRLRQQLDITDPRLLLVSSEKLKKACKLLEAYKKESLPPDTTNAMLWDAQRIKQAIIHPDTGEKIFMPFRMSGYVPFGSPIVFFLLLPNLSTRSVVFWQWLNQSHNACVNYANRNATKPTPMHFFIGGYVSAVSTAVGIAVGLNHLIKKAEKMPPTTKMIMQKFVPFPAVACASCINVLLMRCSELSKGVEVFDESKNIVGTSKIAAKQGLISMAISRFFLPAPIFLIPPIITILLEKSSMYRRMKFLHLPMQFILAVSTFGLGLPATLALFPQQASIQTSLLEPEIQAATTSTTLYYNKGL